MYKKIPKFDGFRRKDVVYFMRMKLTTDFEWAKKAIIVLMGKTLEDRQDDLGLSIFDHVFFSYHFNSLLNGSISKVLKKEFHKRIRKYAIQMICLSNPIKLDSILKEWFFAIK
jgi:predicted nucleotidyltransferase